jgi:hypothetical protein
VSKRLQVVVSEHDLSRYESAARARGVTLSEWVRQTLNAAERDVSRGSVDDKIRAVRQAAGYSFPAPDIEQMIRESEAGALGGGKIP